MLVWFCHLNTKHIYFHYVLIYSLIQYCLNKWKSSCFAKGDTTFHSLSILNKIGNYATRSINIENQLYLKRSLRKIPLTLIIKEKQQCPQAIPNFLTEMSFLGSPFSEGGQNINIKTTKYSYFADTIEVNCSGAFFINPYRNKRPIHIFQTSNWLKL